MKLLRSTAMILMVLIVVTAGYFLYRGFVQKSVPQITSSGVLERVRSISELNAVEMYFSEIIDYKDAKHFHEFEIPFTEKSFIFTGKARVKAGFDLTKLQTEDILIQDKTIVLQLPAPSITSVEILENKAFSEKDGLFNEISNADTFKALDQFKQTVAQEAEENGILDKAKDQSILSLKALLEPLGFEQVEVSFK